MGKMMQYSKYKFNNAIHKSMDHMRIIKRMMDMILCMNIKTFCANKNLLLSVLYKLPEVCKDDI